MNRVKKNINFFIYFLIITILFLILLKTFNETHSGYTTLFKFYTNKDIFSEDNLLNHSILFKNSIYYSIFKILRFDLDNGIYQFILHTILISSNIFFIYLIIKNFSNQKNNFYIFLFIILISTKNHLVIDGVSSSWAFHSATTPTALAHSLNYTIIYFLLKKFLAISILLTFINTLISFKIAWFVICLIFFYVMLYGEKKYKFLLIFIILILSLIFFKNFELEKSFYNQIELYNFTYLREFDEGSCQAVFDCKNPIRMLIFICSFFIFYFLNKKNNNFQAKKIFYLILILQVLILIFYQTIYFFDLKILKIWQLVALSPVRAVAIYEFFFFFLVTNFLINKKKNLSNFLLLLSYLFFGWGKLGYLISFFFYFFYFLIT